MRHLHQSVGDGAGVGGEPAIAHDLEEKVDEDRVHADDGKKFQAAAMVADVDPPVADGEDQQGPAE